MIEPSHIKRQPKLKQSFMFRLAAHHNLLCRTFVSQPAAVAKLIKTAAEK
jgi:hypothetical protein